MTTVRLACLAMGAVLVALSVVALHDALSGVATGCVRGEYGLHCGAGEPARYAITLVLTTLVGAATAIGGVGALYAGWTWR